MSESFKKRVHDVVKSIPPGSTLTYKEVADRAGSPRAFRSVGSILARNYDPGIPCHRVVRSNGGVGEYNRGGPAAKLLMLLEERIAQCD